MYFVRTLVILIHFYVKGNKMCACQHKTSTLLIRLCQTVQEPLYIKQTANASSLHFFRVYLVGGGTGWWLLS